MISEIDAASTGAVALVVGLVMGLFKFLDRIWPGQRNGPPKVIVDCPNKIHTLNSTLERQTKSLENLEEQHRPYDGHAVQEALGSLEDIEASMKRIEKRTGPIDGVEQWKRSQMQDALLQKLIDTGAETLLVQQKSLLVLEKIAARPPRKEDKPDGKRKSRFVDEPSPG